MLSLCMIIKRAAVALRIDKKVSENTTYSVARVLSLILILLSTGSTDTEKQIIIILLYS